MKENHQGTDPTLAPSTYRPINLSTHKQQPIMQNYQKFTSIVEKGNKPFFALFAILMLAAIAGILQLKVNPDMMIFMPNKSEIKNTFDDMNAIFESGDEMIVVLHTNKDSLDIIDQENIIALHDTLNALPGIAFIVSPVINGEFSSKSLSEEMSPLKVHEGKWEVFISVLADSSLNRHEIIQIENLIAGTGYDYDISGTSYLQKRLIDYMIQILLYLPFIAIFLIFMVFRFQMRSIKATFMSVLPAIVGAVWTLGLAGWIGKEVSIITAIAPVFTIVIGSADGLHFVSHYLESRAKGESKKLAVGNTLKMVGIPMIITTITSVGGFLSLLIMDTNAVKDLAVFAGIGIAFAGLATWFILPLFLINKIDLKHEQSESRVKGKGLKKLWGTPAIILSIILLGISFFGYTHVKTDFDQLSIFKKNTDVYKSAQRISAIHGGSIPLYVLVKDEDNILDNALRDTVANMCANLSQYTKVISPFEALDKIMEQPMFRMMKFMTGETKVIQEILKQESLPIGHMLSLDQNAVKITLLPAETHHETLFEMKKIIDNTHLEGSSFSVTGMSYIMDELNQNMIVNLKNTLIISCLVMFVLLLITFRKILPTLISLIPILITTSFLYGFLGLSGMSLTVITAIIFSISIGIGIDYAVHYTSVSLTLNNAEQAFDYTSRPIMTNALGLAIGMSALFTTPFTIHMNIAILMWVAMVLSMFLSLSLLPTLMGKYLSVSKR